MSTSEIGPKRSPGDGIGPDSAPYTRPWPGGPAETQIIPAVKTKTVETSMPAPFAWQVRIAATYAILRIAWAVFAALLGMALIAGLVYKAWEHVL